LLCYLLQNEKKRLKLDNDLLRLLSSNDNNHKIININSVPQTIRHDFSKAASLDEATPQKQTLKEALKKLKFLKDIIENRDGYKIFYKKDEPITEEKHLHILYDITWLATKCDVNKEVNNGRGPVDFKISKGRFDQTLVEFKLAKDRALKRKLLNQVDIYCKANNEPSKLISIVYLTESEEKKVKRIAKELDLDTENKVILIDGRRDNKPSASVA
jgi:hypothetical protein